MSGRSSRLRRASRGFRVIGGVRSIGPALALAATLVVAPAGVAGEIAPREIRTASGAAEERVGVWSDRVLSVAIEVDAAGARVVAFTVKDRPFARPLALDPPRPYAEGTPVQLEVVLLGPAGQRFTRRTDVGGLCLDHAADEAPHVTGDQIQLHREAFLVELPALEGFDRVEVAYYAAATAAAEDARRVLAVDALDAAKVRLPGNGAHEGAARPRAEAGAAAPTAATALWPEDFADDDLVLVLGDEAEGGRRINVVVVPDGYRYADKALMESHFADLVAYFRATRPFTEHDPFLNYILVYAYSVASGTDQCDCGIVLDTSMGTGFPANVPTCGASDNRCLYYGGSCDTNGTQHIVEAELRAPFHDTTIVMVNTERYGGCGGERAVYSAGNSAATDVAVHELGHSLAWLADEYAGNPSCGLVAGEINTSRDSGDGAWPEWIAEIGAPRQGAQYYNQCIYRPLPNCEMRSLFQPFCPVCNQRWSLVTFGHPNVGPTAPVSGFAPASPLAAEPWDAVDFSVETRFSVGANVTNQLTWELTKPSGAKTIVAGDTTAHSQTFGLEGAHAVTATVVADTNFVKPQKYGANRDVVVWNVTVAATAPPGEVSSPGSASPLRFETKKRIVWEPGAASGAVRFNAYSGSLSSLPTGVYGTCLQADVIENQLDTIGLLPPGTGRFYLVTGENSLGEGTMGTDSAGQSRAPAAPCD